MKEKYYEYLGNIAEEWFREKFYNAVVKLEQIPTTDKIVDYENFKEAIINPIKTKCKTKKEVEEVFEALSFEFDLYFNKVENPCFEKRAALLVSLHLEELALFDNDVLSFIPNNECWFCGKKLPKDTKSTVKFCHSIKKDANGNLISCILKGSNAQNHFKDCCYRNWKFTKTALRQKFRNILESKKYKTFEEKCDEAKNFLLDFCDLRFMRLIEQMNNADLSNYDLSNDN